MKNQKEAAPFAHYHAIFNQMSAEEITKRTHLELENGVFFVEILGEKYPVSHPNYQPETITALDTLLLRYLTEVGAAEETEKFLTFREMPWGDVYLQPFSGRILKRAAFTFGTRLDAFRQAAERIGAKKIPNGDAAYEFEFLKNYRLRLILWQGDEEFEPSAQMLFSANFVNFTAEDRVVVAEIFITKLKAHLR
ncbi:MAG: DUF3786 domain-containing protein [Ruminococcaceae bacterium]|nr:DUF3786 domain-containing protein [Oscillospiraceae bacterium]